MVAVGRTTRGGDASRSWLAVTATPHAALAGAVRGYGGFHESSIRPVLRRELPATDVVVVLDLTGSLRVERPCSPSQSAAGVVAGVGRTPVSTRHSGEQVALEIRMSALAARSLLGASSGELSDRVVDAGELWGRAGNEVLERARQLQTWPERFALVEDVLLRRQRDHAGTVDADPSLAAAHGLLVDREGDLSMQELLDITGWGRRRLADRFREQVGMTPKALARLARFRHAERLLRSPGHRSIASVALTCGYYDQAHLNRDFRELAGCTPTAHLATLRADPATAGMSTVGAGPPTGAADELAGSRRPAQTSKTRLAHRS